MTMQSVTADEPGATRPLAGGRDGRRGLKGLLARGTGKEMGGTNGDDVISGRLRPDFRTNIKQ